MILNYSNKLSHDERSLNYLQAVSESLQNQYSEVVCNLKDCILYYDTFNPKNFKLSVKGNSYHLTQWSLSQLCTILRLSKTYINRCSRYNIPNLVTDNINEWIMRNKTHIVKFQIYNNIIHGIVSEKYLRISHQKVLQNLEESIVDDNDSLNMTVKDYIENPDFLHLRLIQDEPFYVDDSGSPLFIGLFIQNSEVGRSNLFINRFIYRQVCTNGLCVPILSTNYKKRHIGNIDESVLKDEIKNAMSVKDELISQTIYLLKTSQNTLVSKDITINILEKVNINTNLACETLSEVVSNNEIYYNQYELVNLITRYSRDMSIDERIKLETYAGSIM